MKDNVMDGYKMDWYKFMSNIGVYIYAIPSVFNTIIYLCATVFLLVMPSADLFSKLVGIGITLLLALPWVWFIWVSFLAGKSLKAFEKVAPGFVYLIHFGPWALYIVYWILSLIGNALDGTLTTQTVLIQVCICGLWLVAMAVSLALNYNYFEKREKLFCKE